MQGLAKAGNHDYPQAGGTQEGQCHQIPRARATQRKLESPQASWEGNRAAEEMHLPYKRHPEAETGFSPFPSYSLPPVPPIAEPS